MWNRYTGRWKPEKRGQSGGVGRTSRVHRVCTLSTRTGLSSSPNNKASLTFGGGVGCGHKLTAGEPHLWGCKVATELLWLQLDSIVVLVDCFLWTRAGDHFSLLPSPLAENDAHPTTQGNFSLCSESPFCFLEAFLPQLKEGYPAMSTETPTHCESLSLAIG